MTNTNFNGLSVTDYLGKVVERERVLKAEDYNSLSFEEKCEYALRRVHGSLPYAIELTEDELTELKLSVIKRALEDDCVALYYLSRLSGVMGISLEDKVKFLKRASDMGYIPATVNYLYFCNDREERYGIARELIGKIPAIESVDLRCRAIRACYPILRRLEGNDKYPHHHALLYDLYLQLAAEGDTDAFTWLEIIASRRARKATSEEHRREADAERVFWQTVQYTVIEHYYNLGELKNEKHLAYMLLTGIGCDADLERGIKLTLSDMSRAASALDGTIASEVKRITTAKSKLDEHKLIGALIDADADLIKSVAAEFTALDNAAEVFVRASSALYSAIYDAKHPSDKRTD